MIHTQIQRLQRGMQGREVAIVALSSLPLILALVLGGLRSSHAGIGIACAVVLGAASMAWLVRHWRSVSQRHVAARLDASLAQLEDSTDLLLRDRAQLGVLQQLQQQRIDERLRRSSVPDLRAPWPWWRLGAAFAMAALVWIMSGMQWRDRIGEGHASATPVAVPAVSTAPLRLLSSAIEVSAPAYAGLPAREESSLDVKALQGSQLRWSLRFEPQPHSVHLQLIDGDSLAMSRNGEVWSAQLSLEQSALYRIVSDPALPTESDRLHRLDAVPDAPPRIQVTAPDRSLSVHEPGQRRWPLVFSVEDDFAVARVEMLVTLVQGSGEQVAVSEQRLRLNAEAGGTSRQRDYRHVLDLPRLGLAAGDDLIVQLLASDNREPNSNTTRSASFILRWPLEPDLESTGIDGLVQKVMPAYFRSQRQIIIDTEALVAQRAQLSADTYVQRSDAIGVDQKILRLRYGQFLGEEFQSGARPGQPDHADDEESHAGEATQQDALSGAHEHDESPARFGNEGDVVAQFGHTHDHAEAATLLDPETKKLLRAALSEMWQAELKLRTGVPDQALPFENRALGFIKQVQQASRIYLARVGLELPPVDESRRLSGERKDVRDRPGVLVAAERERAPITHLYQALQSGKSPELDTFESWLRANPTLVADALGLRAAMDELRRLPDCADCRKRLLDALWKELPATITTTALRSQVDDQGRHYLDQLSRDGSP